MTKDEIRLPDHSGRFTLICDDCGSCNVAVGDFGSPAYSSWTGACPSIEIHCLKCGNEAVVQDKDERAVKSKEDL